MKTKRTLTIVVALVALATSITFSALRGPSTAKAQDTLPPPVPDRISFPMMGITQGQTMRLSVANISEVVCPCNRVLLNFRNAEGQLLRTRDGRLLRKEVMLEPGRSTFLDLDFDDLQNPPGPPDRLQVRAVIVANPPPVPEGNNPPPIGDRILTSVEVFNNNNGRTVFALAAPPSIRAFPPPVGD